MAQLIRGIGVDAVDIERFRRSLERTPSLQRRLFTDCELAYVAPKADPVPSLAARFASREAVMKAMGVGLWKFKFRDVEVVRLPSGQPTIALFNRADKGNCAACHPSGRGADHSPPMFTDFTYDNLGVPRNAEIPATVDPNYRDMGLCGPDRTDLADRQDLCGAFKVPSLRNVATRKVFFHNGRFKTLRDALRFYVRRDTNPEEFYPVAADGTVQKFDDLPAALHANVNVEEVPYDRKPGEAPRLTEAELDDLESFLNTLTDGYQRLPSPKR